MREGERENHQLKAYSKRKSGDKGLRINIAHALFPCEICEDALRPIATSLQGVEG